MDLYVCDHADMCKVENCAASVPHEWKDKCFADECPDWKVMTACVKIKDSVED